MPEIDLKDHPANKRASEHNQNYKRKAVYKKILRQNRHVQILVIIKISKYKSYHNRFKSMSTKKAEPKKPQTSKKSSQEVAEQSLAKTLQNFWNKYSAQTHPRIKVIDWFIVFLLSIIGLQFFNFFVIGDDFPRNAMFTSVLTPLGVIVLLVEMRKSGEKKNFRKLGEFFVACMVLFMVSINFVG